MIWKIGCLLALWILPHSVYAQNSIIPFKSGAVLMAHQLNQLQAGVVSVTNGSSTGLVLIGAQVPQFPTDIPLKTQAATLLKTQQSYVVQTYAIYGDDTPPEWITCLKALRAIANGTDTTSTVLPTAPIP